MTEQSHGEKKRQKTMNENVLLFGSSNHRVNAVRSGMFTWRVGSVIGQDEFCLCCIFSFCCSFSTSLAISGLPHECSFYGDRLRSVSSLGEITSSPLLECSEF